MALLTANELIEIAVRIEEGGEEFYTTAAAKASTAEIKALFDDLAAQERQHRDAFRQMGQALRLGSGQAGAQSLELILAPDQWDEFQAYVGALLDQSFFAGPDKALTRAAEARDEREALQAAVSFEKETLLFYHELRDVVRGVGQQAVAEIMQQEKEHIQRLVGTLRKRQ